jgi:hypothetical protein
MRAEASHVINPGLSSDTPTKGVCYLQGGRTCETCQLARLKTKQCKEKAARGPGCHNPNWRFQCSIPHFSLVCGLYYIKMMYSLQ